MTSFLEDHWDLSDDQLPDTSWLSTLPSHPLVRESASQDDNARTSYGRREEPTGALQPGGLMVVRDTDLIIVAGKQIRMANLLEAKMERFSFKTLHTPDITFKPRSLALNPSGQLLAVVGSYHVALVVLPRPGYGRSTEPVIKSRCTSIGHFHGSSDSSPIVKISWHPWGHEGSSLLVLTKDGLLREYDVAEDTDEPAQVVQLSPYVREHHSLRRNSFRALDPDQMNAVSFTLGVGLHRTSRQPIVGNWRPFTVYCLMANGDVWAQAPFLPKRATVPSIYISALWSHVRQSPAELANEAFEGIASLSLCNASTRAGPDNYRVQLKYVNALVRQARDAEGPKRRWQEGFGAGTPPLCQGDEESVEDELVLQAPTTVLGLRPAIQGPFLLQPESSARDSSVAGESLATDILHLDLDGAARSVGTSSHEVTGSGVLAIAYTNGRVDICLDSDGVDAQWERTHHASRVGLDEDDWSEQPSRSLLLWESLDLGLCSKTASSFPVAELLSSSHPSLVSDPLYGDTFYVQHALGAHVIDVGPAISGLQKSLHPATKSLQDLSAGASDSRLERVVQERGGCEVTWAVRSLGDNGRTPSPTVGFSVLADVYLGYALFAVTADLALTATEKSLRVGSSPKESSTSLDAGDDIDGGYVSLLGSAPFKVPELFRSAATPRTEAHLVSVGSDGSRSLSMTPEGLRFLGKTVEANRQRVKMLIAAGDEVQGRLYLQLREIPRQVQKVEEIKKKLRDLQTRAGTAVGDGQGQQAALQDRIHRAIRKQNALLVRVDQLLQKLIVRVEVPSDVSSDMKR